jgi:ribonuclease Z
MPNPESSDASTDARADGDAGGGYTRAPANAWQSASSATHPLGAEVVGTDMEVIFLGTGSCLPTVSRGVACSVLRLDGSYWMFDAGEGTQVQLQRSQVRPGAIDRIFITHLHGDHAYGLPGVLCLIGNARGPNEQPIELYGPAGLRLFVRTALALSRARALPRYCVHELHEVPFLHGQFAREPAPLRIACSPHTPFEQPGEDLYPERVLAADGTESLQWRLVEEEGFAVRAAPLQHTVQCVGYVVRESDRPGRLRIEDVLPRLEANREGLRAVGVRDPKALLKQIKAMEPGDSYDLPDGTTLRHEDAVEPMQRGRKVAILGDTCDASPLAPLARGCDLVVHEATNTYMAEFDGPNERDFDSSTFAHGHSTPRGAAGFAARVGARALVLTHFSQRHHPASKRGTNRIEDAARRVLGGGRAVVAAHDLSRVFVSRSQEGAPIQFIPAPEDEGKGMPPDEAARTLIDPRAPVDRAMAGGRGPQASRGGGGGGSRGGAQRPSAGRGR